MFPLRCTVACEIFSKSSMGNPIENVFIGEMVFPPGLQLAESPPVPRPLTRKHTSATENLSIGERNFSGPDVFSPMHCRVRVFF